MKRLFCLLLCLSSISVLFSCGVTQEETTSEETKMNDVTAADTESGKSTEAETMFPEFTTVDETTGAETEPEETIPDFVVVEDKEAIMTLPKTFGSHMVLQRDADIRIFGRSNRDGAVIRGTFKDQTVYAIVKEGAFTLTFKPEPASKDPAELKIEDDKGNVVKYDDVLVGDVWLFAGQSNANISLREILRSIKGGFANQPEYNGNDPIRYFMQRPDYYIMYPDYAKEPCDDFYDPDVMWKKPDQSASLDFSALGFWFARRLTKEIGVPVGAVCIAANGAEIQELMSKEAALSVGLKTSLKVGPGGFFNTMVNPLLGISFKGMVFFQGESEGGDGAAKAKNYAEYLKAYVTDMKEKFDYDFPFYNFQLSSYSKESLVKANFRWVNYVRFGQYDAMLEMENENLIPSYDLRSPDGHSDYMHSPRKEEQADRVLDLILAKEYGVGNKNDFLAPVPVEIKLSEDKKTITVKFKNTGDGLVSKSGTEIVNGFYIGNDAKLTAAQAEIVSNDTVLVHVPQNAKTDKIAYAFDVVIDEENTQLYNSNGLPALAFMLKTEK